MELTELVNPKHTVVVTMEMQRGVVGDLSSFSDLQSAAENSGVLVFRLGYPVKFVEGEVTNIKVTYPKDLLFVEELLKEQ